MFIILIVAIIWCKTKLIGYKNKNSPTTMEGLFLFLYILNLFTTLTEIIYS